MVMNTIAATIRLRDHNGNHFSLLARERSFSKHQCSIEVDVWREGIREQPVDFQYVIDAAPGRFVSFVEFVEVGSCSLLRDELNVSHRFILFEKRVSFIHPPM